LEVEFGFSLKEILLGHVDLGLTVVKRNGYSALDFDTVVEVENVANGVAVVEGMVGYLARLLVLRIGESDHELSSGEGIEAIVSVAFDLRLVPDLGVLPVLIDLSNLPVKRSLSVETSPQRLSVFGVVTTTEILLRTIVDKWDSSAGHGEDNSAGEADMVTIVVEEASVVMVVDKDSKSVDVLELAVFLLVPVFDVCHALAALPHVFDSVIHGVVEHTRQVVLVGAYITRITVETFSHLEDSCRATVLSPEILGDLRDSVDSDSIEIVSRHGLLDPVFQVASNVIILLS